MTTGVAVVMVAGGGFAARARAEATNQPLPTALQGRCPKGAMQALPGDAVARAVLAALVLLAAAPLGAGENWAPTLQIHRDL